MCSARERDGSDMTNSRKWSSGRRNGSSSSAAPEGGAEPGRLRVGLRRDGGLSAGMAIVAAIEARLFRFRLLSLNAVIDVVPAQVERGRADRAPIALRPLPSRRRPAGSDLAAASRAIEAGAEELRNARRRMP